jgi:hypothetical protein
MKELWSRGEPAGSNLTRRVAKNSISVVITLLQSHAIAAEQVNRRPNFQFLLSFLWRIIQRRQSASFVKSVLIIVCEPSWQIAAEASRAWTPPFE